MFFEPLLTSDVWWLVVNKRRRRRLFMKNSFQLQQDSYFLLVCKYFSLLVELEQTP
jgi:hypothetical protein